MNMNGLLPLLLSGGLSGMIGNRAGRGVLTGGLSELPQLFGGHGGGQGGGIGQAWGQMGGGGGQPPGQPTMLPGATPQDQQRQLLAQALLASSNQR